MDEDIKILQSFEFIRTERHIKMQGIKAQTVYKRERKNGSQSQPSTQKKVQSVDELHLEIISSASLCEALARWSRPTRDNEG